MTSIESVNWGFAPLENRDNINKVKTQLQRVKKEKEVEEADYEDGNVTMSSQGDGPDSADQPQQKAQMIRNTNVGNNIVQSQRSLLRKSHPQDFTEADRYADIPEDSEEEDTLGGSNDEVK